MEALTDEVEERAWEYIKRIDAMGGSVSAIEQGFMQNEIARSSYEYQDNIEKGKKIIVGVNKFTVEEKPQGDIFSIDDSIRNLQVEKLRKLKSERDNGKVKASLAKLAEAAKENSNLMPCILDSVENYATLGEIADVMRKVFGEYK